jgi:serine/threonine protein kinase
MPEATLREYGSGQKLFGRYTLIKMLGRGGMGIVWLARDEELEREVALKFLPDLIIHDRALRNELKRETKRSLELTHKNIVRIYDFVHDERSACISMETSMAKRFRICAHRKSGRFLSRMRSGPGLVNSVTLSNTRTTMRRSFIAISSRRI